MTDKQRLHKALLSVDAVPFPLGTMPTSDLSTGQLMRFAADRIMTQKRALDKYLEAPTGAKWEINCDGYYPYCSLCGEEPPGREMSTFCPNCGARMGVTNETD